jgi:hypothetical protein
VSERAARPSAVGALPGPWASAARRANAVVLSFLFTVKAKAPGQTKVWLSMLLFNFKPHQPTVRFRSICGAGRQNPLSQALGFAVIAPGAQRYAYFGHAKNASVA